jgi:hypothetical protein
MISNKPAPGFLHSPKTLERALARQQKEGGRLGAILETMGVITDEELV